MTVRTQISVLFVPSKRCLPAHRYPRRERALTGVVHTAKHGTLGTWLPGECNADAEDEGHLQAKDTLERGGGTVRCARGAQETDASAGVSGAEPHSLFTGFAFGHLGPKLPTFHP